jgi:hypothetical protein
MQRVYARRPRSPPPPAWLGEGAAGAREWQVCCKREREIYLYPCVSGLEKMQRATLKREREREEGLGTIVWRFVGLP